MCDILVHHFNNLLKILKLLKYFKIDNALIQAASSCQARKGILVKVYFLRPFLTKTATNVSNHSCQNVVTLFLLSLAGSVLSNLLMIRK